MITRKNIRKYIKYLKEQGFSSMFIEKINTSDGFNIDAIDNHQCEIVAHNKWFYTEEEYFIDLIDKHWSYGENWIFYSINKKHFEHFLMQNNIKQFLKDEE